MFFVTVPRALCTSTTNQPSKRDPSQQTSCNSEQVFWREANAYKRLLGPCFNVLGRVALRQAEGCDETGRRTVGGVGQSHLIRAMHATNETD